VPDRHLLHAAHRDQEVGEVCAVEIMAGVDTETYARAHGTPQQEQVLAGFAAAAQAALREGLGVNAGHDLNRANLADLLRAVPGVQEVSIGHALIADALELGLAETVRDYLRCIHVAQRR